MIYKQQQNQRFSSTHRLQELHKTLHYHDQCCNAEDIYAFFFFLLQSSTQTQMICSLLSVHQPGELAVCPGSEHKCMHTSRLASKLAKMCAAVRWPHIFSLH